MRGIMDSIGFYLPALCISPPSQNLKDTASWISTLSKLRVCPVVALFSGLPSYKSSSLRTF